MSKGPNRFVPSGKLKSLELREGSGIALSNPNSGRFRFNEITEKLEYSENGGAYRPVADADVQPIDTLANLALLDTTDLLNGTSIYCIDVEDFYILDTINSHVVDGLCVIAATGGGYWVSRIVGRWEDLQGSIQQGAGAAALTTEAYRDTLFRMSFFRHGQNDELSFVYQMPHKWKIGTAVRPHLHVVPMADPISPQVVDVDGYYFWTLEGTSTPIPALTSWTTFAKTLTVSPGDVFKHKVIEFGPVNPTAGMKESACLLFYMRRHGSGGSDTYTTNKSGGTVSANLGLLSADCHYRSGQIGTEVEYP